MKRIKTDFDDKSGNLSVTCKCGKPIVKSNQYGMYCEDMCGLEDDKGAKKKLEEMFKNFANILKIPKDRFGK